MACYKCEHKGYIETYIKRDNGYKPVVQQCQNCKDAAAYSTRITQLLAPKQEPPAPARARAMLRVVRAGDKS